MATEVIPAERDLNGRAVGNWRLLGQLGSGGFGAVYEAVHQTIPGRRGAVKVLHGQMALNADIKRRFINEASAASSADHENIVQIFDGGVTEDGLCYVVMELLTGKSLSELLKAGPLAVPRTINIATQVTAALSAAHGIGIVHRDLKPDNIFLIYRDTNPEFVKVLDFGIAKLADGGGGKTQTGMWLGTPPYMAPEQWQTLPDIDGRADLYALGIILYQCLTGALPFSASTPYGWLTAHLQEPVPEPSPSSGPPELLSLVRRLLAKERGDRPQHAAEVMRELRRLGAGRDAPTPPVAPEAPAAVVVSGPAAATVAAPSTKGARPARSMPVVLGLAGALLCGGLWWYSRSHRTAASDPVEVVKTPLAPPQPAEAAPPPPAPVLRPAPEAEPTVAVAPPDLAPASAAAAAAPEAAGGRKRAASKRASSKPRGGPPAETAKPIPAPPAAPQEPGDTSGRRKHEPIY